MSLTKIGSIGINTGIQFAGVTTVSTLKVGSGVTLSSDGDVFATGISTFSEDVKVGSGITVSPDGNIFATGVTTSTTFVGALTGNVTGTLQTAAQANITSLGTLTGLTINGDATFTGSSANIVFDQSTDDIVFNDNAKAVFGTGLDLEIFHDGSNSYIKDTGTGSLLVRGSTISLQSASGEAMIEGVADGAVTIKHDNSTKFETSSTGVSITGNATISGAINTSDNQNINVGNGGDLKIFHDGTDSFIHGTTSTRQLKIRGQEIRVVNEANSEIMAKFIEDGAVELYYDNTKMFETRSGASAFVNGDLFLDSDSHKLKLGLGADLNIYHNGSHSFIDNDTGTLYLQTATNISFMTNNNEDAILCAANGAVSLYHDNTLQCSTAANGLAFPSGKGINFNATSDASGTGVTAGSETFDDYEEGEFIVTLANSLTATGSQKKLTYTKIGNKVHISGQFQVTSGGSDLTVTNLPFTTKSTGSTDETFSAGFVGLYYVTLPTDGGASGEIYTKTQKNDTNLFFMYNRTGNDPNQHTATTNGYYTVSHWYTT